MSGMRSLRPFPRAAGYVAIATAAHVALFLSIRKGPHVAPPVSAEPPPEDAIAIELPAPDAPAHRVAARAPSPLPAIPRAIAGDAILAAREGHREPPGPREESSPPEPAPAPPAGSGWVFDLRRPLDVTSSAFVASATQRAGLEPAPAGASTSGGLVEGMDSQDAARGMGRSGPLLSALESATRASDTSVLGVATFDVAVDTDGRVTVHVLEASSAFADWSRIADATRAAIVPAQIRIPPGARGWHMVARLEAKEQYPNGVDPRTLGTKLVRTPAAIHETKERVDIQLPQATFATAGKVCSLAITVGLSPGISGGCNPENIGAHLARLVEGRVLSEGRL
jgi:hypothetical protein